MSGQQLSIPEQEYQQAAGDETTGMRPEGDAATLAAHGRPATQEL